MSMFERIISLLAPHYCLGCNTEGAVLCRACIARLPSVMVATAPGLQQVWAVTPYSGVAKAAVHRLKFERAAAAAADIAAAIARQLPADTQWVVTHVPTANTRVRLRGYDQAQLIAKEVAHLGGWPYTPLLARMGAQRQVGANRTERQQHMQSAFRPRSAMSLRDQHILLIDDVLTTGSTITAAASTLQAAGATQISAAVFAVV